jgi:hypothetical protein
MATITNFQCADEAGKAVSSDASGNNVAFGCPKCAHPVLTIARENQRASDASHPARCRSVSPSAG